MAMKLVRPDAAFEASYRDYIAELDEEERYPFPMGFDHRDFPAMLRKIDDFEQGRNLPPGFVSSSTFWLVEGETLLGASNLRHELNDVLNQAGGHIGLGVRPSQRGRGLGQRLLRLTVEEANRLGINTVHVHCYQGNERSARMIEACGGVIQSVGLDEAAGKVIRRYVIPKPENGSA